MIILVAAHFAWAGAQVKTVDGRISKMKFTATELAHYMAPGVNLGNTMEACHWNCLLYTSPSPRDGLLSRMPSSA